jgi:hypothetical protein
MRFNLLCGADNYFPAVYDLYAVSFCVAISLPPLSILISLFKVTSPNLPGQPTTLPRTLFHAVQKGRKYERKEI